MENQQAALDAMRQAAQKMKTTNENLFARNFYNRLKLAASVEHQISDGLKKLAKATVGLKPEEIGAGEKKSFEGVAGKQDGNVKDVDSIQNDMTAFLRRMPNEKYQKVVGEMEEKRAVPELGELANFVRANLGLKSVGRAKAWGDQLSAWAEMLRDTIAGAAGLEQAVAATGPIAPLPIAEPVARLARRLDFEPLPDALRRFADEVNHPTADFVVAALVIAAEKEARDLGRLLGQLAVCARETPGAASAPAVAAPAAAFFRKRRRGAVVFEASVMGPVSFGASKAGAHHHGVPGGAATIRLPPDRRYWV